MRSTELIVEKMMRRRKIRISKDPGEAGFKYMDARAQPSVLSGLARYLTSSYAQLPSFVCLEGQLTYTGK